MKAIQAFVVVVSLLSQCEVQAASLRVSFAPYDRHTISSLYLSGGTDNGQFDTIIFDATAAARDQVRVQLVNDGVILRSLNATLADLTPPSQMVFLNQNSGNRAGLPRPAGEPFTYMNRMINADPNDVEGALGWTVLGRINTPGELSFTAGPRGGRIDTSAQPNGELFLANIYFAVPEPLGSSMILAALAALRQRAPRMGASLSRQEGGWQRGISAVIGDPQCPASLWPPSLRRSRRFSDKWMRNWRRRGYH